MTNAELFDIISKQTGIDDLLLIEKSYYECNSDCTKTIFKLLEIELPKLRPEKPKDVFDDLREICDQKDTIFQDFLEKNKKNQEQNGTQPPIESITEEEPLEEIVVDE